jgi:hypothetical protein
MVVDVPVPKVVTSSGYLVSVHCPDEGRPYKTILPLCTVHVGFVVAPINGGEGTALIDKL